jgi:GNAT superfamily N-acetyltransferase
VKVASGNPLYVAPQYRCGVLPGRLMLGAERAARERGAVKVYWHMRADTKAAEMLGEHGYELRRQRAG